MTCDKRKGTFARARTWNERNRCRASAAAASAAVAADGNAHSARLASWSAGGYDEHQRHGVCGQWNSGHRYGAGELAGVHHGCGAGRAERQSCGHAGRGWRAECVTCAECRFHSGRNVLHGGVPPQRWIDEPRILDDSCKCWNGAAEYGTNFGSAIQCGAANGDQAVCGPGDCPGRNGRPSSGQLGLRPEIRRHNEWGVNAVR